MNLSKVGILLLMLLSMTGCMLATELKVLQYKNFEFLGEFYGGPALPDAYSVDEITREVADTALKQLADFLLKRSQAADSEMFKKVVFGLEGYFVQLAKVKIGERSLIMFNAYKQSPEWEAPSKQWVVVDGGGANYFGGSLDEQTNKITISINDPF